MPSYSEMFSKDPGLISDLERYVCDSYGETLIENYQL